MAADKVAYWRGAGACADSEEITHFFNDLNYKQL